MSEIFWFLRKRVSEELANKLMSRDIMLITYLTELFFCVFFVFRFTIFTEQIMNFSLNIRFWTVLYMAFKVLPRFVILVHRDSSFNKLIDFLIYFFRILTGRSAGLSDWFVRISCQPSKHGWQLPSWRPNLSTLLDFIRQINRFFLWSIHIAILTWALSWTTLEHLMLRKNLVFRNIKLTFILSISGSEQDNKLLPLFIVGIYQILDLEFSSWL